MTQIRRVQLLAASVAVALSVDEDDMIVMERAAKRRRTHEFWMSPYLHARTDTTQRNTLAKLESDFLRVCIKKKLPPLPPQPALEMNFLCTKEVYMHLSHYVHFLYI